MFVGVGRVTLDVTPPNTLSRPAEIPSAKACCSTMKGAASFAPRSHHSVTSCLWVTHHGSDLQSCFLLVVLSACLAPGVAPSDPRHTAPFSCLGFCTLLARGVLREGANVQRNPASKVSPRPPHAQNMDQP